MRLLPRILEQNIPGQTVIIGACEVTPSHNTQHLTFPFTQGIPEAREGIGALSNKGLPEAHGVASTKIAETKKPPFTKPHKERGFVGGAGGIEPVAALGNT